MLNTEVQQWLEGQPHGGALKRAAATIATSLQQEGDQVRALRAYNEHARDHDPSMIAWSPTLPIELALKTASPQELRVHYGYNDEEWDALRNNPTFINELTLACETVRKEGMSFKLKARLQAEELLTTQWRLIHAPTSEVPAAVKQRAMETVFRMAGYDNKAEGVVGGNSMLNIQINLGG